MICLNDDEKVTDINELRKTSNDIKELCYGISDYITDTGEFYQIQVGLEEVDHLLSLTSANSEEELQVKLKLSEINYGIEDIDSAISTIKKAAVGIIKFIVKILDRVINFVTSFFNKGMTYTEKFYLAALYQKVHNLEKSIDDKNLNKNAPLDLKEKVIKKILKRTDLFTLEAIANNGRIDPGLVTNYVRNTLTLFTDNVIVFDNTCDTLVNLTKDLKDSTVTGNSFIGFASEKNKFLITTLQPLATAYSRNALLNKVVEKGTKASSKKGFVTYIIPLPLKGREENKIGYVSILIKKPDLVSKMKYDDIKSMDDLLITKQEFIDYKDLGINIDKLDHVKVKSSSLTELSAIVEIYKESSEKIKKKLNTDRITRKLEKLKKKMVSLNTGEFDSKVTNFKLRYSNTTFTLATTILQASRELYSSGYCESIKDYILNHSL